MEPGESGAPKFLIEYGGKLYVTQSISDVSDEQDYQNLIRSGEPVDKAVVAPGSSGPLKAEFSISGSLSFSNIDP